MTSIDSSHVVRPEQIAILTRQTDKHNHAVGGNQRLSNFNQKPAYCEEVLLTAAQLWGTTETTTSTYLPQQIHFLMPSWRDMVESKASHILLNFLTFCQVTTTNINVSNMYYVGKLFIWLCWFDLSVFDLVFLYIAYFQNNVTYWWLMWNLYIATFTVCRKN